MWRALFLALVACGGDGGSSDSGAPTNVCTYESASCPEAYCPPGDEEYTRQCIDTSSGSCDGVTEGTTSTFSPYASTSFVVYTRNVEFVADTTCAELSTY